MKIPIAAWLLVLGLLLPLSFAIDRDVPLSTPVPDSADDSKTEEPFLPQHESLSEFAMEGLEGELQVEEVPVEDDENESEIEHPPTHTHEHVKDTTEDAPVNSESPSSAEPEPSEPEATDVPEEESTIDANHLPINLDEISSEDYGNDEENNTKPDDVDNEVIQQLVDRFLNKGTLEEEKVDKINKAVEALVNSSDYWKTDALEPEGSISDANKATEWAKGYNTEAQKLLKEVSIATWNYITSASPETKRYLDEAEDGLRLFSQATAKQARQFDINAVDPLTRRQLELLTLEGMNALSADEYREYNELLSDINRVYTTTDICENIKQNSPCILKFSDLPSMIATTRDATKLGNLWQAWRHAAGKNMTRNYEKLIELTNKGAEKNGFQNGAQMWLSPYDLSTKHKEKEIDITEEVEKVYMQIEPFYKQLHAYVRRELAAVFNADPSVKRDSPIPVHLLKGLAGEDWSHHYEDTKPYDADDDLPDEVFNSMRKQNFTAKTLFTKAYRYLKYLGFEKLPKSFWSKSVFSRNWSKDMICNPAAAYDMTDGIDYRVKICAQVGEPDFIAAHRLLGELYYKYASRNQPLLLRDAPNPSIQTAVKNVFSIIAGNPEYLMSQRLLGENAMRDEAIMVNKLYKEALTDLVKLPHDIVVDKWRFGVFENKYNSSNWSDVWWKLREQYQGVVPPSGADDDIKYDAVTSLAITRRHSPAVKHFVSYVIQFQILEAICDGDSTPLSEGCIPSNDHIMRLIQAMSKGSEINWLEVLETVTGSRQLDATPLLLYYEPLHNWLQNANKKDNTYIGWDGPGAAFQKDELPQVTFADNEAEHGGFTNDDQVAYPGEDCSNGQECILESTCNTTICVCNEGLYTLQIENTYNCVQGNPADAGFGNGKSLVIDLVPAATTSTQTPSENPSSTPQSVKPTNGGVSVLSNVVTSLVIMLALRIIM